ERTPAELQIHVTCTDIKYRRGLPVGLTMHYEVNPAPQTPARLGLPGAAPRTPARLGVAPQVPPRLDVAPAVPRVPPRLDMGVL
ncbi:hypothetical protein ACWCQL_32275, partial [Streptomyces sp. NPDC002073]